MYKNLISTALSYYGLKEVPGEENNLTIMRWAKELGQTWVQNDETAWCSLAVNAIAAEAGYENSCDSQPQPLMARSWLKVGVGVVLNDFKQGDVCVFWRGKKDDGRKGHVGFYVSDNGVHIQLLGGNQGNELCIKKYPLKRLLGVRRLKSKILI